ncbi:YcaO-like family protein [Poseidonocella sp. HB161398]|uniref:YcaO-like family protein n=1 Tax=Poseidonocella sp. HB161398 TaxID=2320855 RepID=UPI001485F2A8|nr:YcaO-like family protein [Poseidonocella sp. HB161398]
MTEHAPALAEDAGQLFSAAALMLGTGKPPALPGALRSAAARMLDALGYGPAEAGTTANRIALLRLAARLGGVFPVPAPFAPGLRLVGARAPEPGQSGFSGRGLDPARAFETCLGEAAEYLSFLRQPEDPLVRDGHVAGRRLADGSACSLPADEVLRDPGAGAGAASSTGTGAGPDPETATCAALLEAVERDAVARWWHRGESARAVPAAGEASALEARLRAGRARQTWFLDLTPAHGLPVAAALSCDPGGAAVVAGFCAAPEHATAQRGALLELCQMEAASELARYRARTVGEAAMGPAERIWLERQRHLHLDACPCLAGSPAPPRDAAALGPGRLSAAIALRLEEAGHRAAACDITRPGIGIPVMRVRVSGFLDTSQNDTIHSANRIRPAPI